jgi:2-phosphoglycerate kinase
MIYLIGGPPKCGKTTFAKALSQKLGIPWISADTLQTIGRAYSPKNDDVKKYPHAAIRKGNRNNDEFYKQHSPKHIVAAYIKQAKSTGLAIDMVAICEITDGNDYIIEGYQVEPVLAAKLCKKYGQQKFTCLFLTKTDSKRFVQDLKKSTTPNDWIITNTKKEETFEKIAEMVKAYSSYFGGEAKKYGFKCIDLSFGFEDELKTLVQELTAKHSQ